MNWWPVVGYVAISVVAIIAVLILNDALPPIRWLAPGSMLKPG
jgi:hypothetical protein